ncbi:uncharacterized protein [Arachis hypogaea]|uniref:uncharacterized protein n=1 Tax=Arachis hypogaea TaxID=3818 RepID=UPI003B21182D
MHIDEQLAITSRGIYTFRAQDSIYHSIGGFYPDQDTRPRFLQLYIYDTEHELQNKILKNTQLHEILVFKIQQLLHQYNPSLHVFRQLAQRSDVHECSLLIREGPTNQPQYSLPTASQVAAIIVGDDVETMIRGRDIKVQTHAENVGRKRTILPSSFIGSRRDMTQRYEDRMAIILKEENNDKLIDSGHYDSLVRAEIPSKEVEPHLHDAVLKHMIHGPCGILDQFSPCMKNGQCKCNYPKKFAAETRRGDDSYPQYKRRFDTLVPINQNVTVDNRWVVPYNPWLLLKYDCHINVEICSSIKSIKYLYKYCYKGPDRVAMEVHNGSNVDEVQQFVDVRWIATPKSLQPVSNKSLADVSVICPYNNEEDGQASDCQQVTCSKPETGMYIY